MSIVGDDSRRVPIADGSVSWLFPSITDPNETDLIRKIFEAADHQLGRLSQLLPTVIQGVPWPLASRLTYYRLGLAPDYPETQLICEGWSDEVCLALLAVPRRSADQIGTTWSVRVWVELTCDVDPLECSGHFVDEWIGQDIATPIDFARQVDTAARWAVIQITTHSPAEMRSRDTRRGHPPLPRRAD